MPRQFKLLSQHYIDDRLLEAGAIIGEGTEVPFLYPDGTPRPPSTEMEGIDEDSQAEIDAVKEKAIYGIAPQDGLPMTMGVPLMTNVAETKIDPGTLSDITASTAATLADAKTK